MALLDAFKDIVDHTYSLGFIDMVKIIGSASDARLETIDADKTVVIYGEMKNPIAGIESSAGLTRLAVLKGNMDSHEGSTVTGVSESRAGINVPSELKFDDSAGFVSNYRFMSETMINEQVKVPPFKGATWNVSIVPEKKAVDRLAK